MEENEKVYCVEYYHGVVEHYAYTVTSNIKSCSYVAHDYDIPKSQLLTREQARKLARELEGRWDNVSVHRVFD